jgi:hypothetical protein
MSSEHASVIYFPIDCCDIIPLENVNKRIMKYLYILKFYNAPKGYHNGLLFKFGFLSLSVTRKIAVLKFVYKLVHFKIDISSSVNILSFVLPGTSNPYFPCKHRNIPRSNLVRRYPLQGRQQGNKSRVLPHLLFYRNVFLSLIVHIYTCYTQSFYWLPISQKKSTY